MSSLIAFLNRNRLRVAGTLAVLLFLIAAFNIFTTLGVSRIRSWDEARHGVSSCEMLETGNYIVNTYNYEPDYWNVKPILSFYNNMFGMAIFGKTVFGFRFFSALCYLLVAGLMFYLLWHESGAPAALVGAAAFIVSPANALHSFTTGDPDATFMMFSTASFVFLWLSARKGWMLSLAAMFLGLAFLAKSFHVGVPCMLALIFVAIHWKRYSWRDCLLAAAAGMAPVLIWGAFRYSADGLKFFQSMVELDLLGRVSEEYSTEHAAQPWYVYFKQINHYLLFIPLGEIAAFIVLFCGFRGTRRFFASSGSLWKWAAFSFVFGFTAFSMCSVKLPWYVLPSFLYIPIMFGVFFQLACDWLTEEADRKRGWKYMVMPLAMIGASLVWLGVGEGKAIRNIVRVEPQRDVLTIDGNGETYRGGVFYCVDPEGNPNLPRQKHMLVFRLLDGHVVLEDLESYRNATDQSYLICSFDIDDDDKRKDAELLPDAERFAAEHSLRLISCVNGLALYSR